jgi:hypothetical protein
MEYPAVIKSSHACFYHPCDRSMMHSFFNGNIIYIMCIYVSYQLYKLINTCL